MKLTLIVVTMSIVLTSAVRYPLWPSEFRWNSAGPIDGWTCTKIIEPADSNTWRDNYFCHRSDVNIRGIGMRWSSAGRCSHFGQIREKCRVQ